MARRTPIGPSVTFLTNIQSPIKFMRPPPSKSLRLWFLVPSSLPRPHRSLRSQQRYSSSSNDPSDSQSSSSSSSSQPQDSSIFSSSQSPWDHLFDKIDDLPPLRSPPPPPRPPRQPTKSVQSSSKGGGSSRRQTMTAREISTFDEMFNMIFNAVSEQHKRTPSRAIQSQSHPSPTPEDPLSDVGIGRTPQSSNNNNPFIDILGKLTRHSRKLKWTSELDEQLDRKKEEMDLCDTDQELLNWALREVFGESKRYEAAARQAMMPTTTTTTTTTGATAPAPQGSSSKKPTTSSSTRTLQPETYPHLLAHLMRTFRDKYHDPHLALSMFDYARHLSVPSYVFGCSTPAYNELIQTRWSGFRDLIGVHDALEEMNVNGIVPDARTRNLVDGIRRQIGDRNLWVDDNINDLQDDNDDDDDDVFSTLAKIEALAVNDRKYRYKYGRLQKKMQPKPWDAWKSTAAMISQDSQDSQSKDGWKFGEWDRIQQKRDF